MCAEIVRVSRSNAGPADGGSPTRLDGLDLAPMELDQVAVALVLPPAHVRQELRGDPDRSLSLLRRLVMADFR